MASRYIIDRLKWLMLSRPSTNTTVCSVATYTITSSLQLMACMRPINMVQYVGCSIPMSTGSVANMVWYGGGGVAGVGPAG